MSQEVVRKALEALARINAVNRDPPPPYSFDFDTRHTDPYWRKVMVAWQHITVHKYLPGAMQSAAKHHPDRYHHVTNELPAEWVKLWDEGAPLDAFQAALDRWVYAHEELIRLFPVSKGNRMTAGRGR